MRVLSSAYAFLPLALASVAAAAAVTTPTTAPACAAGSGSATAFQPWIQMVNNLNSQIQPISTNIAGAFVSPLL